MFLSQLFEAIDQQHASFCFGRMNPPTLGHGQLINTVANAARGGDYYVFVSQTQDSKKNPLDYATKIKFLRALFPKAAAHVVEDTSLKTIMQVASWLYKKGYRSVTFVAGSDRLENFQELLEKYNGVEGSHVFYKFDTIDFVSSGDRDPDSDGLAGISATAARAAAERGDLVGFGQATGAGDLATKLYDAVRKGMMVEHIVKHGSEYRILSKKTGRNMGTFPSRAAAEKHERDIQYFKHANEDIDPRNTLITNGIQIKFSPDKVSFHRGPTELYSRAGDYSNPTRVQINAAKGTAGQLAQRLRTPNDKTFTAFRELEKKLVDEEASGYIPKNDKEAKDPRYSTALTVDVHPDTPDKNLKAFKLV